MACPKPIPLTPSMIAEMKWLYFFDGWDQQALGWEYRQNPRTVHDIVHGLKFVEVDPQPPLKAVS